MFLSSRLCPTCFKLNSRKITKKGGLLLVVKMPFQNSLYVTIHLICQFHGNYLQRAVRYDKQQMFIDALPLMAGIQVRRLENSKLNTAALRLSFPSPLWPKQAERDRQKARCQSEVSFLGDIIVRRPLCPGSPWPLTSRSQGCLCSGSPSI